MKPPAASVGASAWWLPEAAPLAASGVEMAPSPAHCWRNCHGNMNPLICIVFSKIKTCKSNDEENRYMFRHLAHVVGHLLCASSPVAPQLQVWLWQQALQPEVWWGEAVQPQVLWQAVQPQVCGQQAVSALQPWEGVEWPQAGVVRALQPWEGGPSAQAC